MRLIRDGGKGGEGYGGGGREREIIYLSQLCHHQNDLCSDEKPFLMFHNCEGHSHKTVFTDHDFRRERTAEEDSNRGPSAYQPNALPLGQTGSQGHAVWPWTYILVHGVAKGGYGVGG